MDFNCDFSALRESIKRYISGKRYSHTLCVEEECIALADIFELSSEDSKRLRAAALLHDITKELKLDAQLELCRKYGVDYDQTDISSPKVFHSKTGAAVAANDFPDIADELVVSAIRRHTTGAENMSVIEKLLYLADYIEPSRKFEDCITLRKYFYDSLKKSERFEVLDKTLILSFDMTIRNLLNDGETINTETIKSRNYLLLNS